MKESVSFETRKAPAEVFEALTDLERLVAATGGQVAVEPVPDRPRRGAGAAVTLKTSMAGGESVRCETLDWEPPRRCVRKFFIKDLPTTLGLMVEAAGAGARVTLELDLEPQSMMYKMLLPALALKLRGDKDKLLARLQHELKVVDPKHRV